MEDKKRTRLSRMLIADIIVFIIGLLADQVSKAMIRMKLPERSFIELIPGWLQLYHHENTGATWGMLKGQTVFFIFIAIVVVAALVLLLLRIPEGKKYIRLHIAVSMILAGAVGNTVDRLMKASVTDFIYVVIIHFPVFNVADMFIVIATIWIVIQVLFIYKEEDLEFLNSGKVAARKNAQTPSKNDSKR